MGTGQESISLKPTVNQERISVVDILRGFALFGILLINMRPFSLPSASFYLNQPHFPDSFNRTVAWIVTFLGDGKFNSIFSFLFGVGFAIQMERAASKTTAFVPVYLRRLLTLLVIGLLHFFLLWNGDVLYIYATLGLLLLLFRHSPPRYLLVISGLFLIAPIVRAGYRVYVIEPYPFPADYWLHRLPEQVVRYSTGTYSVIFRERIRDYLEWTQYESAPWFAVSMATTMFLGFYAGRQRYFQELDRHRALAKTILKVSAVIGFSTALFYATSERFLDPTKPTWLGFFHQAAYCLNRPFLGLFYVSGLVLLLQNPKWLDRLRPILAVGRMPLTNYIMQSVFCTTLYYGYGFGLFGRVGDALGVLVAITIFLFQVLYSNWWLASHRFGPLEWLWRVATYGKWLGNRLEQPPLAA